MSYHLQLLQSEIERAARRAEDNPLMLAWAFVRYRQRHQLSMAALAKSLGLSAAEFSTLALCRRPEPGSVSFFVDIERLTQHTDCDRVRLAALLREAEQQPALSRRSWGFFLPLLQRLLTITT